MAALSLWAEAEITHDRRIAANRQIFCIIVTLSKNIRLLPIRRNHRRHGRENILTLRPDLQTWVCTGSVFIELRSIGDVISRPHLEHDVLVGLLYLADLGYRVIYAARDLGQLFALAPGFCR